MKQNSEQKCIKMITIRITKKDDIHSIISFDQVALKNHKRVEYINRVVNAGECYVGAIDSLII